MKFNATVRQRAYALTKVVEKQCPKSPCASLHFAIFAQAVQDAFMSGDTTDSKDEYSARQYLTGDMPHLEQVGIDPDWVKRKIKDAELDHVPRRLRSRRVRVPTVISRAPRRKKRQSVLRLPRP